MLDFHASLPFVRGIVFIRGAPCSVDLVGQPIHEFNNPTKYIVLFSLTRASLKIQVRGRRDRMIVGFICEISAYHP